MQTFNWPDNLRPASVDWSLIVPQSIGRSVFDSSDQAQTIGAPRWAFTITTGVRKLSEVPEWEALIHKLRGKVNRVRCWDWRREAPLGVATGAPMVRLLATGASLTSEGWTPNTAGILKAGSYFSVNGELKLLTATVNSDASGRATLSFEPPLRASAPAGAPLLLVKPTAAFVLMTDRPGMAQEGGKASGATHSFEEDVRP